jgi:hypothetical protein
MTDTTTPHLPSAIEHLPTDDLIPYARNSRTHSPEQVAAVAASIRQFGFTNPVLIDGNNTIIAGHGRVMAAQSLGLPAVPCIRLGHLSDAQRRAYVIADNKLAELSGWDMATLAREVEDLMGESFDVSLLGFGEDDLAEFLDEHGADPVTQDEKRQKAEKLPVLLPRPISVTGDVWLLGRHRVMCGSSAERKSVLQLMNGKKADVCLTDPPYGLSGADTAKNDYVEFDDTKDAVAELAKHWLPIARELSGCVVFTPGVTRQWLYPEPNWVMCWFYGAGQSSSSWGFACWQPVLCYGKDPSLATGNGRRPDAVNMNTPANASELGHPCPKPLALWEWFLDRLSFKKSDLFFEPFSGSGTTLVACEIHGRTCYAMELSPQYVDMAIRRWQDFTGKKATLESTGQTFEEVAEKRLGVEV